MRSCGSGRRARPSSTVELLVTPGDVEAPEGLPVAVEGHRAQVEDRLGAGTRPPHPRALHAVLDEVLAGPLCDSTADRIITAKFGHGVAFARLWIFRLSNGALVRAVDKPAGVVGAWVAANHDGSVLAESVRTPNTGPWMTTIARADDGSQVTTIDGFVAQGFSGDGELVVGAYGANRVAVIEWKTGRIVWNATGQYGGFRAEPNGKRLAVGVGFLGGSDQRDVYLVAPDGSALLLPASVRASLRY